MKLKLSTMTNVSILFFDWDLKANQFKGMHWHDQCELIIKALPQNVFISFDIDGLIPALCPATGTPGSRWLDLRTSRLFDSTS
jgi:agmatinase